MFLTSPGDVVSYTDANGSKTTNTWDCMGININSAITPAAGVGGTTAPASPYDRGHRAFIDSPNGRMTTARHEAAAQCREIGVKMIEKVPAGWLNWCGTTTAHKCGTGRRAKATVLKALSRGGARLIGKRYLPGGINGTTFAYNNTNPVVGNTTGYDPADNKNFERALHAEITSSLYQPFTLAGQPDGGYDSINRLLQYQRGILSPTGGYLGDGGGSISTPTNINNTNASRNFNMDGLGNWRQVQTMPANSCSGLTDIRSHNKLNEITQRNTYENIIVPFSYDGAPGASNGNLINDGTLIYKYDALNRLVQVSRVSDGLVIATYVYDALNRRVRKIITNGGLTGDIPDSTTDYFYSGWQVMEERNAANNTPLRQYVWGNYIDECIQLTTFAALGAQNLPVGAYYLLQDLLYRAVALTNSTGAIVEAYGTDAYGNTLIFTAPDPSGNWFSSGATQSAFGANEIIFCGYRFDPETILYYVRNRTYGPALGRWLQRDPIWYVDGENLYGYVGGTVLSLRDPHGLYGGGSGDCEIAGFHWLDNAWSPFAILPGARADTVAQEGTQGLAVPHVYFRRRYVKLFKCCDATGRPYYKYGAPAVATGWARGGDGYFLATWVQIKILLPIIDDYFTFNYLGAWCSGDSGVSASAGGASQPNSSTLRWSTYASQMPGKRVVKHIPCDPKGACEPPASLRLPPSPAPYPARLRIPHRPCK